MIGGIWSLWVFFLSRTLAGSLIITQTLKEVTNINSIPIAIIEVRVKNIGRTKVDMEYCSINAGEITDAIYSRDRIYTIGTEPIKVDTKYPTNRAFSQAIFNIRIDVVFKAKGIKNDWTSGAIYKR